MNIFTYSTVYPIPHCINTKGHFNSNANFFSEVDLGIDSVCLDDDALTSLIVDMELESMNTLPELKVVNSDLTDCCILTTTRERTS